MRSPLKKVLNKLEDSYHIYINPYKTHKHTFHKGEYVGHLELAITDDTTIDQMKENQTNSKTLQKMMAEQVKPDVFNPSCHTLTTNIQNEPNALLKEYESQFTKDETSFGTTPFTSSQLTQEIQILFLRNLTP